MAAKGNATSVVNGKDETITRTITNNDGAVLVRIGQSGEDVSMSNSFRQNGHVLRVDPKVTSQDETMEEKRKLQHAKNIAYRQSSTQKYMDDTNNTENNDANSGHLYYTKVSSAKQQTGSENSPTSSFITRKITKGRLSGNFDDDDQMSPVTAVSDDAKTGIHIGDQFDHVTRKKLNYREGGSIKDLPKNTCFSCRKTVYPKEKIGPIRDVLYHQLCFRCCQCGFLLNLTNFHHNSNDLTDKGLYCKSHEPVAETAKMSIKDKTIQAVINKPKVEQMDTNIRGGREPAHVGQGPVNGGPGQVGQGPVDGRPGQVGHGPVNGGPRLANARQTEVEAITITETIKAPKLETYSSTIPVITRDVQKNNDVDHAAVKLEADLRLPKTVMYSTNTEDRAVAQEDEIMDTYYIGMRTMINPPNVDVYIPTVRPVQAVVQRAPMVIVRNPTEYMTRQVQNNQFRTPTPPSSPQHVHFNGNTKTYYYSKEDPKRKKYVIRY